MVASLSPITKVTGLAFVEVPAGENPVVHERGQLASVSPRYEWRNSGRPGHSGTGSTNGTVSINDAALWPGNSSAGFGVIQGVPGRGRLVIHETMQTLGFAHVEDRTSVMHATAAAAKSFSTSDLQGLRTLYPKAGCKSS